MSESTAKAGKIAVFLPSLRGGGAERVMLTLANAMAGRGIPVDLILCQAEGKYLQEIAPGVAVVDLAAPRVAAGLPGLVRYLRAERPVAVISAMNHANVVALLAAKIARVSSKVIVTEHNTLSKSTAVAGAKGALLKALMRVTYARCHRVVTVSDGVAADLTRELGLQQDRVRTIYNPVVSDELLRRSHETPPEEQATGRPLVVAVGRLTAQKDYPTLLRAFARMKPPAALAILGTGPLGPDMEALARDVGIADRVRFLGFQDNPYGWMRAAGLFVRSSAWQGLPTGRIEAMACGTAVVSTDCPSGPDEILEHGKWGDLVPVGDDEALARAIEDALRRDERPDVTQRAKAFTVGTAVEAYLDLVETPS